MAAPYKEVKTLLSSLYFDDPHLAASPPTVPFLFSGHSTAVFYDSSLSQSLHMSKSIHVHYSISLLSISSDQTAAVFHALHTYSSTVHFPLFLH